MLTQLTKEVIAFKKTGRGYKKLLEKISLIVYYYPKKKLGWDLDDCSDFFCMFYPKIAVLIDRYSFNERPFEAYLSVTINFQLKTFLTKRSQKNRYSLVFSNSSFWSTAEPSLTYWGTREEGPDNEKEVPEMVPEAKRCFLISEDGKITDTGMQRRLLFLTLTGSMYITMRLIEAVSTVTGYTTEWLVLCIEMLKHKMETRYIRIRELQERRSRAYLKVYKIHQEITECYEENERIRKIRLLNREQHCMRLSAYELSKVPTCPTHKDIADVLDIPKGSVDSGLYYIKHSLSHLLKNDNAEQSQKCA